MKEKVLLRVKLTYFEPMIQQSCSFLLYTRNGLQNQDIGELKLIVRNLFFCFFFTILQVQSDGLIINYFQLLFIIASSWEIRNLRASARSNCDRCLVTHMLERDSGGWFKWKRDHCLKFEKSIPYALLNQVSG